MYSQSEVNKDVVKEEDKKDASKETTGTTEAPKQQATGTTEAPKRETTEAGAQVSRNSQRPAKKRSSAEILQSMNEVERWFISKGIPPVLNKIMQKTSVSQLRRMTTKDIDDICNLLPPPIKSKVRKELYSISSCVITSEISQINNKFKSLMLEKDTLSKMNGLLMRQVKEQNKMIVQLQKQNQKITRDMLYLTSLLAQLQAERQDKQEETLEKETFSCNLCHNEIENIDNTDYKLTLSHSKLKDRSETQQDSQSNSKSKNESNDNNDTTESNKDNKKSDESNTNKENSSETDGVDWNRFLVDKDAKGCSHVLCHNCAKNCLISDISMSKQLPACPVCQEVMQHDQSEIQQQIRSILVKDDDVLQDYKTLLAKHKIGSI